jgi:hypothetical protein
VNRAAGSVTLRDQLDVPHQALGEQQPPDRVAPTPRGHQRPHGGEGQDPQSEGEIVAHAVVQVWQPGWDPAGAGAAVGAEQHAACCQGDRQSPQRPGKPGGGPAGHGGLSWRRPDQGPFGGRELTRKASATGSARRCDRSPCQLVGRGAAACIIVSPVYGAEASRVPPMTLSPDRPGTVTNGRGACPGTARRPPGR